MKKTIVILLALALSAGLYAQRDSVAHRFALRYECSFVTAPSGTGGMKHQPGTSMQLSAGYRLGQYWELMGYAGFRRCEVSYANLSWTADNSEELDLRLQPGTYLVWGAHAVFHVLPIKQMDKLDGVDPYFFLKYGWMGTDPDYGIGFGYNFYPVQHIGLHVEIETGRYSVSSSLRDFYGGYLSTLSLRVQFGVNYRF